MHWFGLPLASNNCFFPRYFHFVFKVSDFWARQVEDVLIFLLKRKKTLHCIIDAPSLPFIISMIVTLSIHTMFVEPSSNWAGILGQYYNPLLPHIGCEEAG